MKEQMTKIKSILNERLVKYGFKKRGYDYFVRMADEDIIQNIGFGIATYGEKHVRYLNPSIGVIYKDVNKLELHLRNLEKTKYTISFSMKTKFLHAKIILKAPNSQRIPE